MDVSLASVSLWNSVLIELFFAHKKEKISGLTRTSDGIVRWEVNLYNYMLT